MRTIENIVARDEFTTVLEVGYMPSVTAFVTGWKCQDCDWSETDRE